MRNFYDFDLEAFEHLCHEEGWPSFRAKQLYAWQARGFDRFEDMHDLPQSMRERLAAQLSSGQLGIKEHLISQNSQSEKFILDLGQREYLEAVLMRHRYGNALCVSTQAGCKMGCDFCASGHAPFGRQLSTGEMLEQVVTIGRMRGLRISHIDLMGIGEPLDNYEAVLALLRRLGDAKHLKMSMRQICLSTCGLVPEILRLAEEGLPITLAISLHASNQAIREQFMPIARRYAYDELLQAGAVYFQKTGRRVSYEYALFHGVNDHADHARELAKQLRGQNCHVNLIPANPIPGGRYKASPKAAVQGFLNILRERRIQATLRRSFGGDIAAACGQLRRRQLLSMLSE